MIRAFLFGAILTATSFANAATKEISAGTPLSSLISTAVTPTGNASVVQFDDVCISGGNTRASCLEYLQILQLLGNTKIAVTASCIYNVRCQSGNMGTVLRAEAIVVGP